MISNAVAVTFYGSILELAGKPEPLTVEGCRTIRELVSKLGALFGDDFSNALLSSESCFFLINGKGIMATGGLESEIKPGDKIEILPFIDAG